MARIRQSVKSVNPFNKYTLKELHLKIKDYNIQNYAKMKKAELINFLNERFVINNEKLILKSFGLPNQFQNNQQDDLAFNPEVFTDEYENTLFDEPILPRERPTGKGVLMPATKGSRKTYPKQTENKKKLETKPMRVRRKKD